MTKKIRNSLLGVFSLAAMTTMCLSVAFSSKLTVKAEESNVFEMVYGAGIRVSDPTGMRFKTKFSENYYTELTTEDTDTQLFVSIFPYADYINYDISGQDLMPWLDSYYGAGKYINIAMDPTKFYQEANDDCYYANAVISNINFNNYYREFVGVAYLRRGTADNYTYEYTTKAITKEDNARSVFEVATKANMDEEDRENHGEALEVFIKNGLYGAYGVKYDKNTNTYSLNGNTYTTIEDVEEVVQLDGATLSLDNAALTIGESKQLTPTLTYADGTVFTKDAICIWNSSNPSVATVDENGTVTAISEGETTITLTACGGLYTATATISVSKVEPIGVVIEETLYDSTGEFKGSATTEVAAPEGFENVHKYVGTGEYIHGANYSAKCLSDYSFVTFAIKTPKMLIGNGGWIETEDWLVFELTQTSEAVWTITVLKNGEVLHTAENMSGNRDGGAYVYNALDSILYGVPAPEYYVGGVNNVLTAYFTEVRGVKLIGEVIEETLYDPTGEFAGTASNEVAAPAGFTNVHKYVGTGENIHGANYSAKCLSDYSFVTFAIKTPKMLIGNGGWIETEDWLVFELTQTGEALWTIKVLKNGEVLHTAENMSGNRDGGAYVYNALDSILYGVPAPEYYVGSVNNVLTAYFTEVRGISTVEEPEKPEVELIGVVIEETLYDSTGEFAGSATTEVAAPEGFENVHKFVGTGENIHGANYSAKCLSDYSFVTFAIKTPKMLIGNGGWIETDDWLVFELTQTSEAVWTIKVLKNGEVLHTAENMSGNRDGGAYVYNALDSILYGVPAPEYYVGGVDNVLTAYFTEVRGELKTANPQ